MALELLTVDQMYEADRLTAADHVPSIELMENAGQGCADIVQQRWRPGKAVILCGPGNNGGDGYVIARHLKDAGWDVVLSSLVETAKLNGDAAIMAERWDGQVEQLKPGVLENADLIVDALFGAGLTRPIDGLVKQCLQAAHAAKATIVAVDVPSGIDGNTGTVEGYAAQADLTLTFCRKNWVTFCYPAE